MKSFKIAISVFAGISCLSTASFAAAPMKGMALPVTYTPFTWTGFYAGLNLGAVQHTMSITDNQATTFNATIQQTNNPRFTGGLQAGYRRQLNMSSVSGVYGLELSANFSNATFSKQYGSPFALYQLNAKNSLKDVGLLQLIGGIAAEKTLIFLSAGFSWSKLTGSMTNVVSVPFFNSVSFNKNVFGTALGGGIEYALNQSFSVRLKVDDIAPGTYSTTDNIGDVFQVSNNIVQGTLGVNYKFG